MKECDNFSIDQYRSCPRKYYWRIKRGLIRPTDRRTPLEFGIAMHKAMESYYRSGMVQDGIDAALISFTEYFVPFEIPEDDKRTVGSGLRILDRYFTRYHGKEPFGIIDVEVGSAFELGEWIYRSRLDLIVEWESPRGIYVCDHKTSSQVDNMVVKPHNQLTGYECDVREKYENVLGSMLNLIGVYKSEKQRDKATGEMREREIFIRATTSRTPLELEQWRKETLWYLHQIEECEEHNIWPMNSPEACKKWRGRCQFLDLCLANEETAGRMIGAGLYEYNPWRPYEIVEEETE